MLSPEEVRKDIPFFDSYLFLDIPSTSPNPRPVIQAMVDHLEKFGNRIIFPIGGFLPRLPDPNAEELAEIGKKARESVRKLINARDISEISLGSKNTSEALNWIVGGIDWKKDDEVIRFDINIGEAAALVKIKRKLGIKIITLKADELGLIDPSEVEKNITDKTKMIFWVGVQNRKGTIEPNKEICKISKEHNVLTCMDAAQQAGRGPLFDVQEIGCDFTAFPARKGLMGPHGQAILYGRKELLEELEPIMVGDMTTKLVGGYESPSDYEYRDLSSRFDGGGCINATGVVGLGAATDYIMKIGIKNIRKRIKNLYGYFVDEMQKLDCTIFGPTDPELNVGICCFNHPNINPWELSDKAFEEYNMILRANAYREVVVADVWRIGFHYYNTEEDIDKVASMIKKMR